VLKLRFAVCLALVVGITTVIISVLNEARPMTILYRTIISISVFGVCGYFLGSAAETFLLSLLPPLKTRGQKIDIISEKENSDSPNTFDPFTPDKFEQISSPKE